MAGDWIKMRGALLEHPKVVAISRHLLDSPDFREWLTPGGAVTATDQLLCHSALRCVTCGLLLKVWSTAREHGKFVGDDLVLAHSTLSDLDKMSAPGMAQALIAVGWAIKGRGKKNGVTLPRFIGYNVPMTPAERQKALRKRTSRTVTQTSRALRDNRVTNALPEKRREEKSKKEPPTPPLQGGKREAVSKTSGQREPAKPVVASELRTAVVALFYPSGPPDLMRREIDRCMRDLVGFSATSAEVKARHRRWREVFPDATCTLKSMVKHWDALKPKPPNPYAGETDGKDD